MTKKLLLTTSSVIALTCASHAGEEYSAKSSKAVIPPPAPECRLEWFVAASAGYLTDAEEEMYHLQFGVEKACSDHSHALYLEIGYTEFDYRVGSPVTAANIFGDIDVEIIPITLNYKYQRSINQNLSWYAGVGAGIALVDQDVEYFIGDDSFDDTVFYAQAFAGLIYDFNPNFEVFLGARYIYMDDPDLSPVPAYNSGSDIDGDVLVELGARYTF